MSSKTENTGTSTKAVHAGEPEQFPHGAVIEPVYMSSTFVYDEDNGYHAMRYMRSSNTPNHDVLNKKVAALEGTEASLITGSGMSAISAAVLTVLNSGDHLLTQRQLYGGTLDFFKYDIGDFGIEYDFIDVEDPDSWKSKLKPNTKAIYCESISNPLTQIGDLPALTRFAREHGIVSLIDNTVTSPVNFRPVEHSFDIILHSATKYLNGHSDLVAGVVAGNAAMVEKVRRRLSHLGGSLDAHACFLLSRGIKTLPLRMMRHNQNGLDASRFLEDHPLVTQVNYPGLPSHPNHERAKKLFDGYSGLLSFTLPSAEQARVLVKNLSLFKMAPSLGGIESLVTRPLFASHTECTPDEIEAQQISPELVRISVGIEDSQDIIDDLAQTLSSVQ